MKPLDICGQRLANQHLVRQTVSRASEIVRIFGAVQAQEFTAAKWGLAQRTRGAIDSEGEEEIGSGAILRTHVLRPTWHFVAPEDIRWMLALTAPRVKTAMASYDRKLELDAAVLRRSREVLTQALTGGKQLTRKELAQELTRAGVHADGTQRLAHLVMHAELDGLICSGARRGKQFTYALLDERVPATKEMERDEALRELATRYFTTRGPATVDDFSWWSGLTKGDAKRATEIAGKEFECALIGKREYWFKPRQLTKPRAPIARLLPIYDEYFIGLKDRTAMQAKLDPKTLSTSIALLFRHVIAVDGQIVGGWNWTSKGNSVVVELKPLTRFGKAEREAIATEIDRFKAFSKPW